MVAPLDATKVINGSFGQLFDEDGNWMTNVTGVDASIEIGIEEVKRAGSRWLGNKTTTLKGSGTITSYMVTTEFMQKLLSVTNDRGVPFVTSLIVKLDDPESYGAYRVRLKNVTFDKIPLVNFEHGTIVEQELTFVFAEADPMDLIVAN